MPPKSKSNKKKKKCVESKPPALECTLADPPPSISRLLQDLNPLNLLKTVCAHPGCTAPAHKKCSVCEGVRYCSKAHQTLNWQMHKLVCEPVDKQINHGTRFDTPGPSPHANLPSAPGRWTVGETTENARLKTEYIMGNGGLMQEVMMLAWHHRALRPVIIIDTLASGENAHDPNVTLVPEEYYQHNTVAEKFRQVNINETFIILLELRHIPHEGPQGCYVRGAMSMPYITEPPAGILHPGGTKMEEVLAYDAKERREFELMEGPVDHDWTKPGGRESEGGFIEILPTDVWETGAQIRLQEESEPDGKVSNLKFLFCSEFKEWFERIPIGTKVRLSGMTGEGAKLNGKVGVIHKSWPITIPCSLVVLRDNTVVLAEVRACELMRPSNAIARRTSPTGTN